MSRPRNVAAIVASTLVAGCITSPEADLARERALRQEQVRLVQTERRAYAIASYRKGVATRLEAERNARRARIDEEVKVEAMIEAARQSPLGHGAVVALLPFEGRGAVDASTKDTLDALLFLELTKTERFRFVPRAATDAAGRKLKAGALAECYDERCAIEIGHALAAERVLAPRLFAADGACIITLTLYDLKTETGEWAATSKAPCEAHALRDATQSLATRLVPPDASDVKAPLTATRSKPTDAKKAEKKERRPPRRPFTPIQ